MFGPSTGRVGCKQEQKGERIVVKQGLKQQIQGYLADHKKKKRFVALLLILSACTVMGVFGTTLRPAISMEKTSSNPITSAVAAETGGTDFGQYITSATVKVQNGSSWGTPTQTITQGDKVKVAIDYTLPADVATKIKEGNRTITYQLPTNIKPDTEQNGNVTDKTGKIIGTYKITTDGFISITFDENFVADGQEFSGDIQYKGTASMETDGKSETATIGVAGKGGTTITVNKKTDLSMTKTGKLQPDGKTIAYTLTASTTNGTDGTVTISDAFQSKPDGLAYDAKSFSITKVDANGQSVSVSATPTFSNNSSGNPIFEIKDLPELAASEKYVVFYNATVTPQLSSTGATVNNSATATSGKDSSKQGFNVTISNKVISKSGYQDSSDGKIHWTITVNPDKVDIEGAVLSDTITTNDGSHATLPDTVTMKTSNGTETQVKLPYTFPKGSKDTYTVTYTTDVPTGTGGTTTKVTNDAKITKDNKDYDASTDVTVNHKAVSVEKFFDKETNATESGADYNWKSVINLPEGGVKPVDNFVYTDTITDPEGHTGVHFTTAAMLQQLQVTAGSTTLKRGTDYKLYKADGTTEITDFTDTAHLQGFQIKLLTAQTSDLTVTYATHATYTGMQAGDTWKFSNTGAVPGKSSKADHSHTVEKPLEKQISTNNGVTTSYQGGDKTLEYKQIGNTLYYRILLHVGKTNDAVDLTDVLPTGANLVDGSVSAGIYVNDYYTKTKSGNYDFTAANNVTATMSGTNLKIHIAGGYNSDSADDLKLVVTYKLSIKDDPSWTDNKTEKKEYTNKVTWGTNTDSQTTTVKRETSDVVKTGSQLLDANGNPTNTVEYNIVVNPLGKDLSTGADTIRLKDNLNLGSAAGAELLVDKVALYQYDSTKPDNRGEKLDRSKYSYQYDDINHILTFTLPDSTPCVLVYDYNFDRGSAAGDISLSNSVELTGSKATKSDNTVDLKNSDSSATATKKQITIYKVDGNDYAKLLQGAQFTLQQYTKDSNGTYSWSNVQTGLTTDAEGKIVLDLRDETIKLQNNVLYRLHETKAPEGYGIAQVDSYFVWMAEGKTADDTKNAMSQAGMGGISDSQIHFFSNNGGGMYISDTCTSVSVRKVWQTTDGKPYTPTDGTNVQFQLYRQAKKLNGNTVTLVTKKTQNGQQIEVSTSKLVLADGSSLTVNISQWNAKFTIFQDGNTVASLSPSSQSGTASYTFNQIKTDTTITVTTNQWDSPTVTSSGYTLATAYVDAGDKTAVGDPVTLNAKDSWQYAWPNLDNIDPNGSNYYYTVEEVGPYSYAVSYSNNKGIQTGEIVATNTVTPSYILPLTGGFGTRKVYLAGSLLLLLAGFSYLIHKRKQKGRGTA